MWFVKNYGNKNTKTNKLIISIMSNKTNLFEIWHGDEVSKKLRQSKSMCKEIKKICKKMCGIYLNRDECEFLGKKDFISF